MIRSQETLNLLLDNIIRFVRERLVPNEEIVAETDQIPAARLQEMKDLGLFGLCLPEEYGGPGVTMEGEVLAAMELGKTSPAFRSAIGKIDRKMGQKGAQTCDVIFDNCCVPAAHLIGEKEGVGFKTAMKVLDKGRLRIAAV